MSSPRPKYPPRFRLGQHVVVCDRATLLFRRDGRVIAIDPSQLATKYKVDFQTETAWFFAYQLRPDSPDTAA